MRFDVASRKIFHSSIINMECHLTAENVTVCCFGIMKWHAPLLPQNSSNGNSSSSSIVAFLSKEGSSIVVDRLHFEVC